jgi:CHAD domain-containing protein
MTTMAAGKRTAAPSNVAAVRRTLVSDLSGLLDELPAGRALSPEEVHACRKRLKRMRAMLALLRPALDERSFLACDGDLRAAGKALARARNAAALAQVEQELLADATRPHKRKIRAVVGRRSTRGAVATEAQASQTRRSVASGARRLRAVGLHASGWAPLGEGLRRVYRRGRRLMPDTAGAGSQRLHAWRRHVKRYWHLLETFEPMNPRRLGPEVRAARLLSELLGQEHDLALLEARLSRRERRVPPGDTRALTLIGPRRAELTARALRVGRRLYAAKPRQVEADLRRDWQRRKARRRS